MPLQPRPLNPLLTWLGGLALAVAATAVAAAGAPEEIVLTPQQVQAGGLRSSEVAVRSPLQARYPGVVVVPPQQVRMVAAPLAGLVVSVAVSAGDTVRAGQVLAVLHSAQARELQHEAQASRLLAEQAEQALARDERLFAEGLVPQARLEASRTQARLAASQREDRRAALAQAGAQGDRLTLVAPAAGVVLERHAYVGQRVEAAAPLLQLARLQPLWVELQVPVRDAGALRPGAVVQVAGQAGAGRVIALGAQVDPVAQTLTVRAEVPAGGLRPGQALEATVIAAAAADATAVPPQALLREGGRSFVFVELGAGRYRVQPVQVHQNGRDLVHVQGLAPGARVVVAGTAALKALLAQPS